MQSRPTTGVQPFENTRWEQRAHCSAVPVVTFCGLQNIPDREDVLRFAGLGYNTEKAPCTSRSVRSSDEDVENDGECKSAARNMKDLDKYDKSFLFKLAEHCRIKAHKEAVAGNYSSAESWQKKREIVLDKAKNKKIVISMDREISRLEQLQDLHKQQWRESVEEFDRETEEKIDQILEKSESAMSEFDQDWAKEKIEKYRKPSPGLIRARGMEAEMINRDEIDRAKEIHDQVLYLEEREHRDAQKAYERDYAYTRGIASAYQKNMVEKFLDQRRAQRMVLLTSLKKGQMIFENRLTVLRQKKTSFKTSNLADEPPGPRPKGVAADERSVGRALPGLRYRKPKDREEDRETRKEKATSVIKASTF
jgi:hypothetical protein